MATHFSANVSGTRVPFPTNSAAVAMSRGPQSDLPRMAKAVGRSDFQQVDKARLPAAVLDGDLGTLARGIAFEAAHADAPYLDRPAAAKYLHVQPATLAAWACNKRVNLPYSKVGRRVVYRKVDLDAFVAANLEGGVQ